MRIMYLTYYFLIEVALGVILGLLLGRWGRLLGMAFVILGLAPMAILYAWTELFNVTGDLSAYGMLSTIALILFVPFGITMFVAALLRGE